MNKSDEYKLEHEDFANALKEHGTTLDVTVDDLLQLHETATKFALLRNKENISIDKLMTSSVITVEANCSLSEAAHILVEKRISGLPVVDDDRKLAGIITEADFLRAVGIPSHHPDHSLWQALEHMFYHLDKTGKTEGIVTDLMVKNVITILPHTALHDALDIMKQHAIKRLVVCDEENHVTGIITRSDLVRIFFDHFIKQQNTG